MRIMCAKLAGGPQGTKPWHTFDFLGAETATRLQALHHDYQASLRSAMSSINSTRRYVYPKCSRGYDLAEYIIIQVLCKLLFYKLDITGIYDPVYSAVHPMKYLESDVMRYKWYWGLFAKYKQVDNVFSWLLLCILSSQSLDGGEGLETKLWLSPQQIMSVMSGLLWPDGW